jgi:hypothetical protein
LPSGSDGGTAQVRVGVVAESRGSRSRASALVDQLQEAGLDAAVGDGHGRGFDLLFAADPRAPGEDIEQVWTWRTRALKGALEVVLLSPGGDVAGRAFIARDPLSQRRNRDHAAWKAADLLIRRLRGLGSEPEPGLVPSGDAFRLEPLRVLRTLVRRQIDWRLHRVEYFVAYRRGDGPFVILEPPYGEFYADPFPLVHDGGRVLFFEHYTRQRGHGAISYVEIQADGLPSEPRPALSSDHHLSYPFVFRWQDDLFMIPATRSGTELYRCEAFPDRWRLEHEAFDGVRVNDPTVLVDDGRVWLFANAVRAGAKQNEELHLFWSDSPSGNWTAHPWNPVVCDVRSARPAGRIFRRSGKLLRPSQDCSERYGYATVFNRIERMTETEYREVPVARIEPDWLPGNLGTHTYNSDGGIEAVDGYRLRLRRPFTRTRAAVPFARTTGEFINPLDASESLKENG